MLSEEEYQTRLRKLLDFQKEHAPWHPTARDAATLWGLNGASPAVYHLKRMVERGDAIFRQRGRRKEYYAVERQNG